MARKNEYIDKVSKHIGDKIRMIRLTHGYTRKQLSKKIDVTDQQLHKYEIGDNSVSAGRLLLIAKAFNKEISYFFEGLDNSNEERLITQHQYLCINITRNFMQIENPEHQNAINNIIKILAKAA